MAAPSGEPAEAQAFRHDVEAEIKRHQSYFRTRMRWYRALRLVVIVSAAAVPVLASIDSVPRAVLGAFGATAAVAEAVQQLYQLRPAALHAMQTANTFVRELNGYMLAIGPYGVVRPAREERLFERVEGIRSEATHGSTARGTQCGTHTQIRSQQVQRRKSSAPPGQA